MFESVKERENPFGAVGASAFDYGASEVASIKASLAANAATAADVGADKS